MAIEFRCVSCQKLLRVSNDASGKKARCPDCGTIQEARSGIHGDLNSPLLKESAANPFASDSQIPYPTTNPFGDSSSGDFAKDQVSGNPYLSSQTLGDRMPATPESVRPKVQAPAVAMLIISGVTIATQLLSICFVMVAVLGGNGKWTDIASNLFGLLLGLSLAIVIAVGAIKMRRLENYGLAVAASVLSILPCSICCLISTPIGIWSLIVLLSPDVKQVFT